MVLLMISRRNSVFICGLWCRLSRRGRHLAKHDDQWKRVENLLLGRAWSVGLTTDDNRVFIETIPSVRSASTNKSKIDVCAFIAELATNVGPLLLRSSSFFVALLAGRGGSGCLDSSPRILSGSLPGFTEHGAVRFYRGGGRAWPDQSCDKIASDSHAAITVTCFP